MGASLPLHGLGPSTDVRRANARGLGWQMHTGHRENGLDLLSVLSTSDDLWSPRTVAVLIDYDVRPAKTRGAFPRHSHPETDELFLVLSGSLTIRMDAGDVQLAQESCPSSLGRPASAGLR